MESKHIWQPSAWIKQAGNAQALCFCKKYIPYIVYLILRYMIYIFNHFTETSACEGMVF